MASLPQQNTMLLGHLMIVMLKLHYAMSYLLLNVVDLYCSSSKLEHELIILQAVPDCEGHILRYHCIWVPVYYAQLKNRFSTCACTVRLCTEGADMTSCLLLVSQAKPGCKSFYS